MGQKIHPNGFRVGVIKGWDSRWFARDDAFGDLLAEDYRIRKFLKDTLYAAGVPKIEIERNNKNVKIFIHCARPGIIVGRGGADIEKLRLQVEKMIGKSVNISIVEVRSPDLNAQLVAENIAAQLEKRTSFRRAMKQSIGRAMKMGAKGIKVGVSGRLGGAEIARREHYHEGTIPLQTIRADIDYGFAEAKTTYGRIGVKVWLYKGEILTGGPRTTEVEAPRRRTDRRDSGDRKPGGFNNNRNGGTSGGYQNRAPGASTGGYQNRGTSTGGQSGGYQNRGSSSQGGYQNRTPGQSGGYQNRAPGTGYQGRPQGAAPSAPAVPAAKPPRTEGGAQ